jgi:hypothetical protein
MTYQPQMSLREARALYFAANGFGQDGGYEDTLIKVKIWRIPVWLPNTKGRRKAVRLHDLHHVLTEYPTTWRGEAEISAWEIAAGGLYRYYSGWVLDLMNVAQGLVVNPIGTYRAFLRGRHSANLYSVQFSEELLGNSVDELRCRLRLHERPVPASWKDRLAFVVCAFAGFATYLGTLLLTPLILLTVAFLVVREKLTS